MSQLVRSPSRPQSGPSAALAAQRARSAMKVWSPAQRRWMGLAVAVGTGAVLVIAAFLKPSPTGLGTHQDLLHMPPCGWIMLMDLPCPTCGWTTAFAHAADGRLLTSLATQPFGGLLAIATAMAMLLGLYVAVTGSRVAWIFTRLWGRWTGWLLAGMVLAAWIYKVLSYKGVL